MPSMQGGSSILHQHKGSVVKALLAVYPRLKLDSRLRPQQSKQRELYTAVEALFTEDQRRLGLGAIQIISNARRQANLRKHTNPQKRPYYHELDVWIPSLTLGFEYQVLFYVA